MSGQPSPQPSPQPSGEPGAIAIILARGGSKGVRGKNRREVAGRPCVEWTLDAALNAQSVARVLVSTDDDEVARIARDRGAMVVARPEHLATDTARVDDAARHALRLALGFARGADVPDSTPVVILYANVPVRPAGLIDRAVALLRETGADSVQSYERVGKHHPWWTARVGSDGAVTPWEGDVLNHGVFRRQDLPPAFVPDGGVLVVTRRALELRVPGAGEGPHAFFGIDRRGIVNEAGSVVDIDAPIDLHVADAVLRERATRLRIAGRTIERAGNAAPCVIAELGVNHDGREDRALELVRAAALAGADAVKLQHFRAELLMSRGSTLAAYQARAGERDPREMLRRLELSTGAMANVASLARELGLHAIVTVFSEELVSEAEAIGFDAYKVASPDLIHRPLLRRLAQTGRPMILSTGAATLEEVSRTLGWLRDLSGNLAVLQCVSSYPAELRDAELGGIRALGEVFAGPVGYSDHTPGVETGMLAVRAGARILEKHLTFDRAAQGPDHAASLDGPMLAEYVRLARLAPAMPALDGLERIKRVLPCEADVRKVSRQSIVARRDLPAGRVLCESDLTVKRPGTGLEPFRWREVIGRRLVSAVLADMPVRAEDLDGSASALAHDGAEIGS
ncbi:MAG: N-acetylneuraminate synthase family protein [Planctomycetota bacterium]|nr:N-acetylneuraminate synthase family protein [Planctomycetota bacterium]